ncbi:hypothetical protein BABA_13952 [Neobacillus bataviensis LMG 21833]|uniref:Uncharacterized protein n=1 Tax=Neobacillus bataviensis LMG 21833 TaxID=1117379 RepID=K6D3E9_9BACI|nr:hypothetical protein BABA_13952 [Neobacillus bataviensis LMG 21833]
METQLTTSQRWLGYGAFFSAFGLGAIHFVGNLLGGLFYFHSSLRSRSMVFNWKYIIWSHRMEGSAPKEETL